jgi:hypothetical protein
MARSAAVRWSVGKRGGETRAGGLFRLTGCFVVGWLCRFHVLGADEAAHNGKLAVMGDADDGPCPRFLPLAPYIGVFRQRFDFSVKRVEPFGLFIVKLVMLAEFVGFAFRFCQSFGLFRWQRLGLTPYFPETVQRIGIGHDLNPFPSLPAARPRPRVRTSRS